MAEIFIGMKGHVVCIDKASGVERWRTKLKRGGVIPVVDTGDLIVSYSGGHLFGLERETGKVLWENRLPGLGHGYCLIAGDSPQQAAETAIAEAVAAAQQASSGAAAGAS